MAKPLKDQAFATPDKVAELVQKVFYETEWLFFLDCVENTVSAVA